MMRPLVFALICCASALKANSWQARLDKALLSVEIAPQARARLLRRALNDPALAEDVKGVVSVIRDKGFGKGHPEVIETLWPTGTTARSDLEGLNSLRKTLPEAVNTLQAAAPDLLAPAAVGLVSDPKKQDELIEEAKNALRSTPKGLETPAYQVVQQLDGPMFLGRPEVVEVRRYAPFTVARRPMEEATGGAIFGGAAGGDGFNALAKYLFGDNEQ